MLLSHLKTAKPGRAQFHVGTGLGVLPSHG